MSINLSKLLEYKNDVLKLIDFDENLHDRVSLCGLLHEVVRYDKFDFSDDRIIGETPEFMTYHDYLCDFKFCPVCNAYKSDSYAKSIYKQVKNIVDKEGKHLFFMTLTVPNCEIDNIASTLDEMQEAYKTFRRHPKIAQFKSYIRTLEITFNEKKEAHPHYHILLLADKYYFSKTNKNYLDVTEIGGHQLKKLWASHFLKDKHKEISVDFKKAYKKEGYKDEISSVAQELAKYMTKSADLKNLDSYDFQTVVNQTRNRRNITTSRDIKLAEIKLSQHKYDLYTGRKDFREFTRYDKLHDSSKELLSKGFNKNIDFIGVSASTDDQTQIFNIFDNADQIRNKFKIYKSLDCHNGYHSEAEVILAKNPKLKKLIKSRKKINKNPNIKNFVKRIKEGDKNE